MLVTIVTGRQLMVCPIEVDTHKPYAGADPALVVGGGADSLNVGVNSIYS